MNSITVYTKPLKYDSQVRISAIDMSNDTTTNYINHIMQIIRIKGNKIDNTDYNFAYTFGLTFGG